MQKLLYILLAVVGLSLCSPNDASCRVPEQAPQSSVESLYREQLKAQESCNSDAVRTHTISVPATTLQTALQVVRPDGRIDAVALKYGQPAGVYCARLFIHRLSSGDRASDYYLYALCRLRI